MRTAGAFDRRNESRKGYSRQEISKIFFTPINHIYSTCHIILIYEQSSHRKAPKQKYVNADGAYWGLEGPTENFYLARRLTAGVMTSVRAGKTEPLQLFESLLTIQHLMDSGKDWFRHVNR